VQTRRDTITQIMLSLGKRQVVLCPRNRADIKCRVAGEEERKRGGRRWHRKVADKKERVIENAQVHVMRYVRIDVVRTNGRCWTQVDMYVIIRSPKFSSFREGFRHELS